MSIPKHKNPTRENRVATAPYNFVPLPERVVTVVEDADDLPDHNSYNLQLNTGYFVVDLTTQSPLYTRGLLSDKRSGEQESEFVRAERQKSIKDAIPFRENLKNKPDFFAPSGEPEISGSSLRGLFRTLLEIISYGKVSRVTDAHKIFFRAVAAETDDALKTAYDAVLGPQGKRVRAGFLSKRIDGWYVQPALDGMVLGLSQARAFLTLKDEETEIPATATPSRPRLGSNNYRPGYYPIKIVIEPKLSPDGKAEKQEDGTPLMQIKAVARDSDNGLPAMLVCSGDMRETEDKENVAPVAGDADTKRKKHAAVLENPAPNPADAIKINPQAVRDYLDALTPFQKDLGREENGVPRGVLTPGCPVFYVLEPEQNEIWHFGHSPHFRIPALINLGKRTVRRAAVPRDFVPTWLRHAEQVDYTDALFGFVRTDQERKDMRRRGLPDPRPGTKQRGYASRIFVTDAKLCEGQTNVLLEVTEPRILASPKPSTFAHYLVQTRLEQEDLWHYGSDTPQGTVIRGHKLYWPQGNPGVEQIKEQDKRWLRADGKVRDDSTQHTQIQPVRAGVRFNFRIYFENLTDRELGSLCWVLHPLGDEKVRQNEAAGYCHRLGMGKPFGLGSVKLDATLHLTPRSRRYATLFNEKQWNLGVEFPGERLAERSERVQRLTKDFEDHILGTLGLSGETCQRLADLKRIAALLKMMEWPGFVAELPATAANRWKTKDGHPNPRYLTIDLPGVDKKQANEYKQQPILPDPTDNRFGTVTGLFEPVMVSVEDDLLEAEDSIADALIINQLAEVSTNNLPVNEITASSTTRPVIVGLAPAPPPPQRVTRLETVTLRSTVSKNRNAKILTATGQEIVCKNIKQTFPTLNVGDTISADVTYEGEKAIEAVWRAG